MRGDILSVEHPEHPQHPLIWIDGLDEYYCDLCTLDKLVRARSSSDRARVCRAHLTVTHAPFPLFAGKYVPVPVL